MILQADDKLKAVGLLRLHLFGLFATLTRASRAIRKDPATEQETVPGAADIKAPRCAESRGLSETAKSPGVQVCHLSLMRLGGFLV